MPIKDHYRILGIAANATTQDVKKAYRILAHQYHPDKNPDNALSTHRFLEILEAYHILSNEKKRSQYDEERYFAGLSVQKEPVLINSEWILKQAKKLYTHMAQIDSYRMNHRALNDYVSLLLSESHIALLQQENQQEINKEIIKQILLSIKDIHLQFYMPLVYKLSLIAGSDDALQQLIFSTSQQRKKSFRIEKFLPLIVIVIAIALCYIMYLYSRK